MNIKKICVIGGHLTPALAVLDDFTITHPDWQIFFIGRLVTTEDSNSESEESRIIKSRKITFYALNAGRLRRFISLKTLYH
jgi:UDP-N-acetylglucosamine:LPS N-acetylglucosamine transferase